MRNGFARRASENVVRASANLSNFHSEAPRQKRLRKSNRADLEAR